MTMTTSRMSVEYLCDKSKHKFSKLEEIPDTQNVEGKIIIVTGCNSGIGKQVAIQLAKRGAKVVMACRDLERAGAAAEDIKKIVENADLDILQLDLGELASVNRFAEEFKGKYPHLNILVNNAGFLDSNCVIRKTKDGFENHMGINHLGPFLLTTLLIDHLKKASPSRIVSIASTKICNSKLDFDDLMMEKNPRFGDSGQEAYGISKLANGLCMTMLANKLRDKGTGINVYQLCPGLVNTGIFRNEDSWFKSRVTKLTLSLTGLTPEKGAESVIFCALSNTIADNTAKMYRFMKEWENGTKVLNNEELQQKMWTITHELLGIHPTV